MACKLLNCRYGNPPEAHHQKWMDINWCLRACSRKSWLFTPMGWSTGSQMDSPLYPDMRLAKFTHQASCKVYSLLSDPVIAAELRVYIQYAQINGLWIQKNCPNSCRINLFQRPLGNIWSISTQDEMLHRLKKYMEMELFPDPSASWPWLSHCQLPSDGFTRRASNTSTTRRVYTLTDMTDLMLLNTAKIISCQQ